MIRPNSAHNLFLTNEMHILPFTHYLAALSSQSTSASLCSDIHALACRLICFCCVDDSLLDVCRQTVESLLNIDVALCRDLEKWNAELVRQLLPAFRRDHTSVFPITLVSDKNLVHTLCGMLLNVREPGSDICKHMLALVEIVEDAGCILLNERSSVTS